MAKGFFTKAELKQIVPARTTGCASCGLASGCLHPKMEPTGEGRKKILVIAEAPGEDEDKIGTQLIGKVGQMVRKAFKDFGFDLDSDCRKTNSVRCRPPDNRTPEKEEVTACRHHLFQETKDHKPHVIILFGGSAVFSLLGNRWKHDSDFSINRWRGLRIPDQDLNAWVCPTFHPSYVARMEHVNPAVEVLWKKDIKAALNLWKVPLPRKLEPDIRMIQGKQVSGLLQDLWKNSKQQQPKPYYGLKSGTPEWKECWKKHPGLQLEMLKYKDGQISGLMNEGLILAFDYETTGLKPYGDWMRIVSCSVAESPNEAYAWMWEDEHIPLFRELMTTWTIRKIAAQLKFEHNWTRAKLGFEVVNWWWDVMLGAKTLDNRPGNGNLAFQAYSRLGIMGFKDETDDLLRSIKNGEQSYSNSPNQIDKIPKEKLLFRNGMDSALEYAIALHQREEMGYGY